MQLRIPAESILKQMPGVFVIKEVLDKSRYHFVNETFAKMIGFSDSDKAIGLSDEDAKSDAIANNSETFYKHDQQVMTGKTLRTLDIYPYKSGDILGILAIKKPLLDENQKIWAVLAQGFPLKKADIDSIIMHVPDLAYSPKKMNNIMGQTYEIKDELDFFDLTKKELECFFHMLRGKSATEIAAISCRSLKTIETHMQNIKYKCGVNKKSELFDLAYAYGLLKTIPSRFMSKIPHFTQMLS